ncbi:hypothetical protein ACRE_043060 [Hapsidospora chrysogenum ATCC 11550]|uniref:Circumsporozoite protein-like protein n=1 Tax=Hapsidospora chrysogenum (strain ATCC 11550 / CBS 779.69 / DSM 880 / IAM 14645 / JCM 23072 / IMI 49137) TaxID=857340 RepID=A0A086T651_HAPC1|nr:hypothetical protein ACRE_043060 [Hapsidospora chrysogenum ATCC 11550]
MSLPKSVALAILLAVAEARFGQEQEPVQAVQDLGAAGFGDPGVAATIAGSIPSSLLAAASPCEKLIIADQIIDELGADDAVVAAAIGLVAAETNFNPFAVSVPFVCADPTLPVNEQLRGITPKVDPAVDGAEVANAASEQSVATPFAADGLSQAEVMIEQGFTSFTAVDGSGANVVLPGQDGAAAGGGGAGAGDAVEEDAGADVVEEDAGADVVEDDAVADVVEVAEPERLQCGAGRGKAGKAAKGAKGAKGGNANAGHVVDEVADDGAADEVVDDGAADEVVDDGADDGANVGAGNLDFGVCQPTIARVGGLAGRPANEFTFIPQDPLVAEGQQEALNPNIITNRICDQLINVCDASEEAIAACRDAQAEIEALGTRDQSTADTFNALLGFAGVDSAVATI